jgi:hypothetical protein
MLELQRIKHYLLAITKFQKLFDNFFYQRFHSYDSQVEIFVKSIS